MTRINAFLRSCGLGSRRAVEALVRDGRVTVNELPLQDLSYCVQDSDQIRVDQALVQVKSKRQDLLYYKPPKTLVTRSDPLGRRTIFDELPETALFQQLQSVGRLDYLSEGLLLLTSDGQAAHRLLHPRYHHVKVYRVLVSPLESLSQIFRLKEGLQLEDGWVRFQKVRLLQTQDLGKGKKAQWVELALQVGRKHIVRRSCEQIGLQVHKLVRFQFGPFRLGSLKVGGYRPLFPHEVQALENLTKEGKFNSDK